MSTEQIDGVVEDHVKVESPELALADSCTVPPGASEPPELVM
jgi:hypothetical protein